jgi:hypothetical protein
MAPYMRCALCNNSSRHNLPCTSGFSFIGLLLPSVQTVLYLLILLPMPSSPLRMTPLYLVSVPTVQLFLVYLDNDHPSFVRFISHVHVS